MDYTKSRMKGMVDCYQKMYDTIKNWNEEAPAGPVTEHYIYNMGWSVGDMAYHGWSGDAAKNEIYHYEEVKRAHKALKVALQNALGIEQTEKEY